VHRRGRALLYTYLRKGLQYWNSILDRGNRQRLALKSWKGLKNRDFCRKGRRELRKEGSWLFRAHHLTD